MTTYTSTSTSTTTLLDARAVARWLGVSARTLAAWRLRRQGPPYVRVGRLVRYCRADVETWILRQTQEPRQRGAELVARGLGFTIAGGDR
jgi:predicted DNA-binding transcriptional regulator AlpA